MRQMAEKDLKAFQFVSESNSFNSLRYVFERDKTDIKNCIFDDNGKPVYIYDYGTGAIRLPLVRNEQEHQLVQLKRKTVITLSYMKHVFHSALAEIEKLSDDVTE